MTGFLQEKDMKLHEIRSLPSTGKTSGGQWYRKRNRETTMEGSLEDILRATYFFKMLARNWWCGMRTIELNMAQIESILSTTESMLITIESVFSIESVYHN